MSQSSGYAMPQSAAESPEGRVTGKARRISPFRALVWKEWREQRLIWSALLGLCLAVALAARFATQSMEAREKLTIAILFFWGGLAILLGANAFAGERDTNDEPFMAGLPVSRSMRFWSKLAVVAFLLWSAQALTALCMPAMDWSPASTYNPSYFRYHAYITSTFGMLLLSLAAACAASWTGTALAVFFQAVVAGPLLAVCLGWLGRLLFAVRTFDYSNPSRERWVALLTTLFLGHVVLCIGALWLWTAARGGFFRHAGRAAAVILLTLLIPAAPSVAGYLQATLGAPVLNESPWMRVIPSPAGRYALLHVRREGSTWNWSERTVLLDTETSRMVRLSRVRAGAVPLVQSGPWSPDGKRFLFYTTSSWTYPHELLVRFPPWDRDAFDAWWCDAATGERHSLGSVLHPYQDYKSWWWDDHTVAFRDSRGMVFQDLRTGKQRVCGDAVGPREARGLDFYRSAVSATGIWVRFETDLYCYRPDAAVATVLKSDLPESLRNFGLRAVSPDGHWAILWPWAPGNIRQQLTLCSLDTGQTSNIGRPGQYSWYPPEFGGIFTPDSKSFLVWDSRSVQLCDVATKKLDLLYTAAPELEGRFCPTLSPSGKYVLVDLASKHSKPKGPNYQNVVVEAATKRSWTVWEEQSYPAQLRWFGDDKLLVEQFRPSAASKSGAPGEVSLWVVNRDGISKRKVLP